jgi:hypothetical protein
MLAAVMWSCFWVVLSHPLTDWLGSEAETMALVSGAVALAAGSFSNVDSM